MEDRNEYTPDIYTLEDEEGNEQSFEMIDAMDLDGVTYYAFVPYYPNPEDMIEGDCELVVLKSEGGAGSDSLVSIDDEAEYDRIGNMFLERIMQTFEDDDFDDEEEEDGE